MSEQQNLYWCMCVFNPVTWNLTRNHFFQNMDDMEKGHDAFLQGAQQELRKEMATLQKKILMDTVSEESWDREMVLTPARVHGENIQDLVQCSAATAGNGHSAQVAAVHAVLACCHHCPGAVCCYSGGNPAEFCYRAGLWFQPLVFYEWTVLTFDFVSAAVMLMHFKSSAWNSFSVRSVVDLWDSEK